MGWSSGCRQAEVALVFQENILFKRGLSTCSQAEWTAPEMLPWDLQLPVNDTLEPQLHSMSQPSEQMFYAVGSRAPSKTSWLCFLQEYTQGWYSWVIIIVILALGF